MYSSYKKIHPCPLLNRWGSGVTGRMIHLHSSSGRIVHLRQIIYFRLSLRVMLRNLISVPLLASLHNRQYPLFLFDIPKPNTEPDLNSFHKQCWCNAISPKTYEHLHPHSIESCHHTICADVMSKTIPMQANILCHENQHIREYSFYYTN